MESTTPPAASTPTVTLSTGTATLVDKSFDEVAQLAVDTDLYTLEGLFRTCYAFTDRCYLFLRRSGPSEVTVEFRVRQPGVLLADAVGAFANELIDQRVRADLRRETAHIRDWIVAQAFVEADLPRDDLLVHLTHGERGTAAGEPVTVTAVDERL